MRCNARAPRCNADYRPGATLLRARCRHGLWPGAVCRATRGRCRPDRTRRAATARVRPLSASSSQERVFLLSLAQQEILASDPVLRADRARDIVDPLLIHIDATLLDAAARFALGFGEPGARHEIDERDAVRCAFDGDRRNLAGEDVEHLR